MKSNREWPITMTEAAHIASIPRWRGSDAAVAKEYNIDERLVRDLRDGCGYNGVNL